MLFDDEIDKDELIEKLVLDPDDFIGLQDDDRPYAMKLAKGVYKQKDHKFDIKREKNRSNRVFRVKEPSAKP